MASHLPASAHLAVLETHPIQYHAPVYRALQQRFGVAVTVIYGSDFSVAGYRDKEFGATFAWDSDLLAGYESVFLTRLGEDGAEVAGAVLAMRLARALRTVNPLAILLVGYRPRFHQLAFLTASATRAPLLFRGETTDHARQRGALKALVRDMTLRGLYNRCAALLYVGSRSHAHFRRLGCPPERLVFSPYCVDEAVFALDEQARDDLRVRTRESLGIQHDKIVLLFAGKLSHRKGPDLLLLALQRLPASVRDRCVAVFLGSGEMQRQLEDQTKGSPAIQSRFLGFQNQSQLSPIYHASDVLVLPSRTSETWGLVVNEALHHGVPCVVSDSVGSGPDLVEAGRTGEVFETGSVDELARALERALELVSKSDVRERCRRKVASYSVEAAARGITEAYAFAMRRRGR